MSEKVLLVYGGFSAEREVSLSSKNDISAALKSKGYNVVEYDLNDVWAFLDVLKTEKPDVVYNGLYGNWGEDGELQGLLDLLQIPYTHSGLKASALGMDKYLTKLIASAAGVKIAKGEKTTAGEYLQNGTKIPYPYVVKPMCDGSSVGVYIVYDENDARKVRYSDANLPILIEQYIAGRELTVMCLNGKSSVITELKTDCAFYNYQAKYTGGKTRHILPAELPKDVAETCKRYTEIVYKSLGCRTVARCDFRYNEQDGVVLLEINTNPGMTALSLVPEQAKYLGISFADLCDILVKNAACRKRQVNKRAF